MDTSQMESFHLFGDLFVSNPRAFLLPEDLEPVDRAISLIRNFEGVPSVAKPPWDITSAHQRLVEEETAWWRARGVNRPEGYLVRPSGSIDASVACVLFNPTFSVKDPNFGETFDTSNATMAQLERAGFNPDNAFFVDQVGRRDVSANVEMTYPEDLWQVHESFLSGIWDNMKAVVVICWGSAVRKRLLGTPKKAGWLQNLEILKLWGRYSGVEVFLELNTNRKSLKRFVLFVKHPSYFFYIQSDKDRARNIRRKQGRPQDLALEIAAKLGRIQIRPHFYELSPELPVHLAVSHKVTMEREGWKGEAAAQLQLAFPSTVLSQEKSHQIRRPRNRDPKALCEIASLMNELDPGEVNLDGPIMGSEVARDSSEIDDTNFTQRRRRLQIIHTFWRQFRSINEGFGYPTTSKTSTAESIESYLTAMEDMEDLNDWLDLPEETIKLIHDQAGLKINEKPIESRQDLQRAYHLLHNFIPGWTDAPEALGIVDLAISVLFAYGKMISRDRLPRMDELLVLREAPYDILSRKCSGCGQLALDDPFPFWSMYKPDLYVSWAVKGGCGNPGCGCSYPSLKPFSNQVKWSAAVVNRVVKKTLEEAHVRKQQKKSTWLLRTETERGSLPEEVEVKCPSCPQTKSVRAKWTIKVQPTLLVPYLRCLKGCNGSGYWKPVEDFQIIRQPNLSLLWSQFEKKGCLLSNYPRDGSVIFAEETMAFRIAKLKELKFAQADKGLQDPGCD
ncbi:hypothetical protein FE257_012120 [Aspergillus nanangensis]|uniref:Uncharacterized protein n=1 Tax=Aspergillus nanangensis TaxID=2582783 RepID=A0AAD4GS62_ASPNN|nr:hypothetical protein FE257_012120 [Aspergillus nanangensis]